MSDLISRSEIWKPIIGYEGIYEVSNLGSVRSVDRYLDCKIKNVNKHLWKGRIISQQKRKDGRLTVALYSHSKRKRMLVHRVVAEAFIPNPNNYPCINHKDENPANNKVENLEWCTQKENIHHAFKTGLSHKQEPNTGPLCKEILVYFPNDTQAIFPSTMEIERRLNIPHSVVSKYATTGKEYKGMYFRYVKTSND